MPSFSQQIFFPFKISAYSWNFNFKFKMKKCSLTYSPSVILILFLKSTKPIQCWSPNMKRRLRQWYPCFEAILLLSGLLKKGRQRREETWTQGRQPFLAGLGGAATAASAAGVFEAGGGRRDCRLLASITSTHLLLPHTAASRSWPRASKPSPGFWSPSPVATTSLYRRR